MLELVLLLTISNGRHYSETVAKYMGWYPYSRSHILLLSSKRQVLCNATIGGCCTLNQLLLVTLKTKNTTGNSCYSAVPGMVLIYGTCLLVPCNMQEEEHPEKLREIAKKNE